MHDVVPYADSPCGDLKASNNSLKRASGFGCSMRGHSRRYSIRAQDNCDSYRIGPLTLLKILMPTAISSKDTVPLLSASNASNSMRSS